MMIDLGSVDTVLATARSVRRKLDFARPVPREVILECIDIATQAPTGLGGESWRFLVVEAAEKKQAIAGIYGAVLDELAEARGVAIKPTQRALVDRLHEIKCPSLGFCGMNEQMMPESGILAMAKNLNRLRLILVTECGHWVMVEHEDMFNRACLDFLQNG